jgi:hypothetical protein
MRCLQDCGFPVRKLSRNGYKANPSLARPTECMDSEHFAGMTWMFSLKPFLESRYVVVAA